mmetsp:Transcript_4184/g.17760  ORF Transcript_4184/g.17760 Transcript_4184/m.17760 type:complete len:124 (-) Transcript_4184:1237-1608(-)
MRRPGLGRNLATSSSKYAAGVLDAERALLTLYPHVCCKHGFRFCIWAKVNIVFLGAGKQVSNRDKIEKSLSERGVTFYGSDVSQALVDDTISLDSCLQAPIEQLEEALPALRRAAEELTARGD